MRISAVPFEVVDVVWEDARRWLEPAVKSGGLRYSIDAIKEMIDKRIIALWAVLDDDNEMRAAITTRVQQYPEARWLEMDWIGGEEMDKWLPQLDDTLSGYARSMGCQFMSGQGRRGWMKPLGELGWESDSVAYRKDLRDG